MQTGALIDNSWAHIPLSAPVVMVKPVMPHIEKWVADPLTEQAEQMKKVYEPENDLFIFSGSGTSSMDVVSNVMRPGERSSPH